MRLLALVTSISLTIGSRASAQRLSFRGDEYLAGATGNVLLRGPWVAASWRRPMPRLFLFTGISAFYEIWIDPHHVGSPAQGWTDWGQREASYLITEVLIALVRRRF